MRRSHYWLVAILVVGGGLGLLSMVGESSQRALTILVNMAAPWALGAFIVGRLAPSPKLGALAGGATLVVGMATFYGLTYVGDSYIRSPRQLVWTVMALLIGPVMGMCGAVLSSGQARWRGAAIVIPSALLFAEALWIAWDRRVWAYNLRLEPHRFNDVVILIGLIALVFALPLLFERRLGSLLKLYLAIAAAGAVGAVGFEALQLILLRV